MTGQIQRCGIGFKCDKRWLTSLQYIGNWREVSKSSGEETKTENSITKLQVNSTLNYIPHKEMEQTRAEYSQSFEDLHLDKGVFEGNIFFFFKGIMHS